MKNVYRVFLPTMACLTLIAPVWSLPPSTPHDATVRGLSNERNAPQQQSVSGKIASVEKSSFTLTVGQSQTPSERQNLRLDPASPKTMTFQLDKNTTIEGTLKVAPTPHPPYPPAHLPNH